MPTFPWLPEEQNETDAQKITDTIPKEVLAPTSSTPAHPNTRQLHRQGRGDSAAALLSNTPGSQQLLRSSEGSAAAPA